jgi:uncharacterized protein YqjF (DUF2071 family)
VNAHAATCPQPVRWPVMVQDWDYLTFLHWRVEPAVIQRLLPPGLRPDVCHGAAWVGLVPFVMRIRIGPLPPLPYWTIFPETNVRTYVLGPDGRPGVWFLSLDVPRLVAALTARLTYRLPYMWSRMRVDSAACITYECQRRWPGDRRARSHLVIRPGERIPSRELSELDHFLTARWGLWTATLRGLVYAPVEHPPWPLARAAIVELDDTLVTAAGVPVSTEPPLVHYSAHQRARIGILRQR